MCLSPFSIALTKYLSSGGREVDDQAAVSDLRLCYYTADDITW